MTRRILLPLLALVGALFALLAFAAVRIAERRVSDELDGDADRVAETLDRLKLPPERLPEILDSLATLVGHALLVESGGRRDATDPATAGVAAEALRSGRVETEGRAFRVIRRASRGRPEPRDYFLLADEAQLSRNRRDVLGPVVLAGAVGLVVAAGFGLFVAANVTRPVRALASTARAVATGTFRGELRRTGPAEIGDLEEAFGTMLSELREGERRLRESERFAALGRLASGIAHELRNPLTAIRMAVETASNGDDAYREEAKQVAISELDRLDRTLRGLLDFVRPRRLERVEIPAADLLRGCAELLRAQCDHLKVRLEVEAPEGLLLNVDPDRMRQALLNLVLNGAQAQPRGGVVRLRVTAEGAIEVSDEGPGIPDSVRERIFEPFVTTKAAGFGLGLAVVKQVVEEHGGTIEVRTGPGGTTFSLRMPDATRAPNAWHES